MKKIINIQTDEGSADFSIKKIERSFFYYKKWFFSILVGFKPGKA